MTRSHTIPLYFEAYLTPLDSCPGPVLGVQILSAANFRIWTRDQEKSAVSIPIDVFVNICVATRKDLECCGLEFE